MWRELLLDQVEDVAALRARSAHEVAQVRIRLGLEAGAGDGVVDLGLCAPAGLILH